MVQTGMPKNLKLTALAIVLLCFSMILPVLYSDNLAAGGSDSESSTPQTTQPLFTDNFDDNSTNQDLWTKIQVDGGTVDEQNGSLQVTTPSGPCDLVGDGYYGDWCQAGYMTNYAFNVNSPNQMFVTSVNVTELDSVAEVSLMISDQKITNLDPINAPNWYRILKIKDTHVPNQHLAMVESCINGGNVSVEMEGPWASATGQLKIAVFNGSIGFYENGVLRYMVPYLLPSKSCYVSIFTSSLGCFFGTDSFDDFAVQGSLAVTPTPTPTQTSNPTITPTPPPTSQPTPNPSLPIPTIDVSCKSSITANAFNVEIDGSLTHNSNPLADQPILISYSVTNGQSWESLTLVQTKSDGTFVALWRPEVTGNYLVRATFEATPNMNGNSKTINLALTPDVAHNIFTLSSNSTIKQFSFNSETNNLTFTAEGPSGTKGYVNIEIPKTVISDISALKVYLDYNEVAFNIQSRGDCWLISFTYSHSSHQVTLALGAGVAQTSEATQGLQWVILAATVTVIAGLAIAVLAAYKFDRC